MEELLGRVTQQAMNYAIRSGITITASYAFSQSARLLNRAKDSQEKQDFQRLQERLESRVRIISPAIDMIELISARGNTSLETTASLTKSLRRDILALGRDTAREASSFDGDDETAKSSMRRVIPRTRQLLARIEDAVPLINLAITTSGASLSTSLPAGVSPSRLLQASTFLTAGDTQYMQQQSHGAVQIGPVFTLSLYMLFGGHVRPQDEEQMRRTTWKETIHKARVKLVRVPLDGLGVLPGSSAGSGTIRPDEFAYQILVVEDLDDGRMHEDEKGEIQAYEGVARAGIREVIPVHEISRIFYADTGKILNIGGDGEANNPILLLKRDPNAIPPRRMLEIGGLDDGEEDARQSSDSDHEQSAIDAQLHQESRQNSMAPEGAPGQQSHPQHKGIPRDLDPEWLAFEVYTEDASTDTDSEASEGEKSPLPDQKQSAEAGLDTALSNLSIKSPSPTRSASSKTLSASKSTRTPSPPRHTATASLPAIRTSLSLLEMMLRLLSLQQFQQQPHLSIPDEFLSFFLSDAAATTGAAHGDEAARRRMRATAVGHLGFDPYDESPIRRRGEAGIESRNGVPEEAWVTGDAWTEGDDGWPRSASTYSKRGLAEGYEPNRFSASPSPLAKKAVRSGGSRTGTPRARGSSSMKGSPAVDTTKKSSLLANSEIVESIENEGD